MKDLFEIGKMIDVIEKGGFFGIAENGELIEVNENTSVMAIQQIKKKATKAQLKEELMIQLFGKLKKEEKTVKKRGKKKDGESEIVEVPEHVINTRRYRAAVKLFKFIYNEASPTIKMNINKEFDLKINPKPKS